MDDPGLEAVVQTGHGASISSVAVSRDGRLFASGGVDRAIVLWEAATGRELRSLRGHGGNVIALAFLADDAVLVSVARLDPQLRAWEVATGRSLAKIDLPAAPTALAATAGGSRVAVAIRGGVVRVFDSADWKPVGELNAEMDVVGLDFLLDGRLVVAGTRGSVRIWDPETSRSSELGGLRGSTSSGRRRSGRP